MAKLFSDEYIKYVPYELGSVDIATILSQLNDLKAELIEEPDGERLVGVVEYVEEIMADNLYEQ